jgi:uncharacterized repeat protein (TIGR03803 family)
MRPKHVLSLCTPLAFLSLGLALVNGAWATPKYKVLHSFGSGKDGLILFGSPTRDPKGNLYGTTNGGGAYGHGTVYQLTPNASGKWTERILHEFSKNDPAGQEPNASSPAIDAEGNVYVTTQVGGGPYTYGTVFKLTPGSHGWKVTVLHRFGANDKTGGPWAGVIRDGRGNLYGAEGCVFELSSSSKGWKENLPHCFPAFQGDGSVVFAGLVRDPHRNLYGTTEHGGPSKDCGGGCGTIYELSPQPDGKWKETILFGFLTDGAFPLVGALALDDAGNLYGTTATGTIFKLAPGTGGHWKFTVLYIINQGEPAAGVVRDEAGNLYGTTIDGGPIGCGVIYKLTPVKSGKWAYTVLHNFTGNDGCQPDANLILDDKGDLYGTTIVGGAYGGGVVFQLTP